MKTTAYIFIILFVSSTACLSADDIDARVAALEADGRFAEALALCLGEGAGSPAALYFAGDYYYHGREGVERDAAKGKAYYRKALDAFRPAVESGDVGPEERYRLARCIELGLGEAADAKEWYVAAAEGGHTNAMRRCLAYWEAEGRLDDIPEHFEKIPEIWTPEMKAKHGAKLYERPESREKGLAILKEAAQEGSPFALARLSALFYLGEGGVRQDYGMALKLMKAAVAKGFPEDQLPIEEAEAACKRAQATAKEPPPGIRPGDGYPGRLDAYDVAPELKRNLDRFNLTAGWFHREPLAEGMPNPRQARPVALQKRPAAFLEGAVCTAAKPGRDDGTGPERAADGLEATCYVSAEPVKRGDWWQIEFATPVSGRIVVKSGNRDGSGRVTSARVETSSDGKSWAQAGRFSRADGECRFEPRTPVKHLRVVSESQAGETLVLSEVVVSN